MQALSLISWIIWLVWGLSWWRLKTADVEDKGSLEARIKGVNVDGFREDEESLADMEFQR
jgi:hypothetical protein